MNDIDAAEENRLRALLHRAGDGIPVNPPGTESGSPLELTPTEGAGRRGGRGLLAVAVVLAVVIAGGAVFVIARDSTERIDAVPGTSTSDTTIGAAFEMPSGAGPWRLPAEDSGIEVVEAHEASMPVQFAIAVDDPQDPSRWVAVMNGGYSFAERDSGTVETTGAGTITAIYPPEPDSVTGSTWMEVTGVPAGSGLLNIAYRGVADAEVVAAVKAAIAAFPEPSDAARVPAIVAYFAPELNAIGPGDPFSDAFASGQLRPGFGFGTRIKDAGGRPLDAVDVTLFDTGLPPAVAGLEDRLIIDASNQSNQSSDRNFVVVDRPDLGPGAFTVKADGLEAPFVYGADGTSIRVTNAELNQREPAGLADQLGLISSLVAMSREDLEGELARRGVPGLGSGTEFATTTYEVSPTTAQPQVTTVPEGP